jgi:DNA end-binding protein Ku
MARTAKRASSKAPSGKSRKGKKSERRSVSGARPLWSGQLRLSLVSVPVRIYPAVKSGARIAFHQVHEPSGKRVRYEKVVPGIGPIDTADIIKGYEISKGKYVLLTEEEIESAKIEARETCELVQFVDYNEIDPIYFDTPYYLTPADDLAEEPFRVVRDALRAKKKMALGQIVLRGREYIVSIKPCGQGMLLETLRFADEVRSAAPYFADIGKEKSDKELLTLAEELIERKTAPFHPEKFHDKYSEALREMIETKRRTGKPLQIGEEELPQHGAQVIDLVEALKRSVRRAEGGETKSKAKAKSRKAA